MMNRNALIRKLPLMVGAVTTAACASPAFANELLTPGDEVRLESRWKPQTFLNIEKGPPSVSEVKDDWWSARWHVEEHDGHLRLKSRWNGCYLHVEKGKPECGAVENDWWSAQWQAESVDGGVRLRNRWNGCHLNIEKGPVTCDKAEADWWSAQWRVGYVKRAGDADLNASGSSKLHDNRQAEIDEIHKEHKGCPVQTRDSEGDYGFFESSGWMCFRVGEYASLPEHYNDDIEWVRIYHPKLEVHLYEHGNFQGRKVVVRCKATELIDEPENEVSSLKVIYNPSLPAQCKSAAIDMWD